MLKIEVLDLERSHNVSVVDDDIFSSKAICVFLITVCISSCSNCDLLHKIKVIPLTYVYLIINWKGPLLKQKYKQTQPKEAPVVNRLKSPDFGLLNVDRYANGSLSKRHFCKVASCFNLYTFFHFNLTMKYEA